MKKSGYDMLYLVSCALNGEKPEVQRVTAMELSEIYTMAYRQSLIMCVITALEDAGVPIEKKWMEKKEKSIRNALLFEAEYETVRTYFESHKIWFMPLKGWILKAYYPKKSMRQMADIDILFDETYRNEVKNYFESRGYACDAFEQNNHDVYLKQPVYNYEMHVSLFDEQNKEVFYEYYKDVKERLIKKPSTEYEYRFSKEDYYIYILAHAYKHYSGCGTGIRSLVDFYVFLRKEEENLDWKYLSVELDKIGLRQYEEKMRLLSKKVLVVSETLQLSCEEEQEIEYCLFSGTYGIMRHYVENKIEELKEGGSTKHAKRKYFMARLFPSRLILERYCPAAKKYRMLLGYAWCKRTLQGVIMRNKSVKEELQYIKRAK